MGAENLENLDYFVPLYVLAQIVGLLSVVLVFYWCISFGGGFGLSPGPLFQWHPLFMTIGLIYLLGNGIMTFRVFRSKHRNTLKWMHFLTNAVGLVFTLLAALAVLSNNIQFGSTNFYSMHSWAGLITIVLYLLQAIISITAFLLNAASNETKVVLLPFHVYLGLLIFSLGIGTAVIGVTEEATLKLGGNYSKFVPEAIVLNSLGVLYILFGAIVVYISTNIHYKRYPNSEEDQLLTKRITSR